MHRFSKDVRPELRYASHLGFRSPDRPLFLEHVGSLDPGAHVAFAAALGFAGVMHPWALTRPSSEIDKFAEAAVSEGLEGSCVVFAPLEVVRTPLWTTDGVAPRQALLGHMARALAMAGKIQSRTIAVILTADEGRPLGAQRARARARLREAGDLAAEQDCTIVVETMRTLPNMLLRSTAELAEFIGSVAHRHVKIAFDTHHCASLDGVNQVHAMFAACFDDVGVLQLASYPEKTEVGSGEIDFTPVLAEAIARGFRPLVELEHHWTEPGLLGEVRGLERFWNVHARALASVRSMMGPEPDRAAGLSMQ